jgi:hypothetical protein
MTLDEAREVVIEGMNYAAYKETDSSLYEFPVCATLALLTALPPRTQ